MSETLVEYNVRTAGQEGDGPIEDAEQGSSIFSHPHTQRIPQLKTNNQPKNPNPKSPNSNKSTVYVCTAYVHMPHRATGKCWLSMAAVAMTVEVLKLCE